MVAAFFPWLTGVRGVEVAGALFLPRDACPLNVVAVSGFPGGGRTPEEPPELCGIRGFHSGGGTEALGCGFFPLGEITWGGGGAGPAGEG